MKHVALYVAYHIDRWMQKRRNSIANGMEYVESSKPAHWIKLHYIDRTMQAVYVFCVLCDLASKYFASVHYGHITSNILVFVI